jgi:periplasmic protein TonB
MAYLQHTGWKDRPGAVAGVIGIHALIGYALIAGLSFTGIADEVRKFRARDYVDVPLPPPPPEPAAEPEPSRVDPPAVAPIPKLDLSPAKADIDTTPVIVPTPDFVPRAVPTQTPAALPAKPAFDPVGPKPRGNPGNWVTVEDYRSSWINREMTGTARFRLEVGASGRVETCTITASSGHPELDRATCALVSQRARFEPARDASGAKATGSYANSVRWELPE